GLRVHALDVDLGVDVGGAVGLHRLLVGDAPLAADHLPSTQARAEVVEEEDGAGVGARVEARAVGGRVDGAIARGGIRRRTAVAPAVAPPGGARDAAVARRIADVPLGARALLSLECQIGQHAARDGGRRRKREEARPSPDSAHLLLTRSYPRSAAAKS